MVHTIALAATLVLLGLPAEPAAADEPIPIARDLTEPPVKSPPVIDEPFRARPAALVPLYASFASLQAADLVLTQRALARGASEANPIMRGVVGSPAGFVAAKAGLTMTTIFLTEKLRKRHPKGAVVLLVALDAALAAVVTHNAMLVSSLRHAR